MSDDAAIRAKLFEDAGGISNPLALSTIEVHRLSRRMRALRCERDVRMAFAGNVVFDPLAEFVEAHLACSGLTASSYMAPFGQPLQELLDPQSGLHRSNVNFLLLHFELDALGALPSVRRIPDSAEQLQAELEEAFKRVEQVVGAAVERTSATVLVTNFVEPDHYSLGLSDSRAQFSEQEFFSRLNLMLASRFRTEPRVQVVDLSRLTAIHGRARARDRRLYYVAKLPWHESFLPVLADELTRHVKAVMGRTRKCLVVDLDNTLWGGVLGEEGPGGVQVGAGDPISEAHFDLQRRILAISRRGVLLAACSKNNPSDVEEVFRVRKDMPLRREDFVCVEIGWELKHEGLCRIAEKLNIGTDSLVFLDDNPAEIELIRQLMPEVECALVPSDPALRAICLDRIQSLDRAMILAEDRGKTQQYQQSSARDLTRRQFSSVQEYLHSLQTHIWIASVSAETLARAHQLFTKTNQFNVTTRRYSLAQLQSFASEASSRLLIVRVEDRFGDSGWVGAVLLRKLDQEQACIDSFILSCRAMGRGIETAVLNDVQDWCFQHTGCTELTAQYLPTPRNAPVRELFEQHGFAVTAVEPSGAKTYLLRKATCVATPCDWISCHAG